MYELYPYFTNDGTVGLFSREDDDIYHSTYGALSESWQKFILPSKLEQYLQIHNNVKILDICYGIGYNSKTALNVFVKNFLEKQNKNQKKIYKFNSENYNIETIDADNNYSGFQNNLTKSDEDKINNNVSVLVDTNEAIDSDNIAKPNQASVNENSSDNICTNFLIDAIDIDRTLISLSPFIKTNPQKLFFRNKFSFNFEHQNKALQIAKINNQKPIKLNKKYKLKQEVPIIILLKLLENDFNIFNNPILQTILTHKKYEPFLSDYMFNFAKFYQNNRYNSNKKQNKMAFLHNIYYKYLSKSYKNVQNILQNTNIDMNFYTNDAREFIKSTDTKYNFVFLDAFTPAKCPILWSVQFFREIYARMEDDGVLLTYSSSSAVRNALLKNGFYVGKIFDNDLKKYVGTIASKNKDFIEHELNQRDIDLINSKAGICYRDEYLNLDISTIIENRDNEVKQSELASSSKILKGYKNVESL